MAAAFEPRSSFRSSQQQRRQSSHRASSSSNNNNSNGVSTRNDDGGSGEADNALPSIDFGFDELRRRMGSFTSRFDEFIASGRAGVLSERNAHRTALSEVREETALRSRGIGMVQGQASAHAAAVRREAAETAEMEGAIGQLSGRRDGQAAANEATSGEIASTRAAIAAREAAQRDYAARVATQARLNAPELAFYEDHLGLRIESPADDEIAFVFIYVDERDPEREFEVVLDLGRRDYVIKRCTPALDADKIRDVLDRLNEGRDLAPFLKEMRKLFQAKSKEGRA